MKIISLKPINNSSRHHKKLSKSMLSKRVNFLKVLRSKHKQKLGRSSSGRISAWHRQRGAKRLYRKINSLRVSSYNIVLFNSYDPFRTSFSSCVFDLVNKKFGNKIASSCSFPGILIHQAQKKPIIYAPYQTCLTNFPAGTVINQLSNQYSTKIAYIRAAGSYGQIVQVGAKRAKIKMPSGIISSVPVTSKASLGSISNGKHRLTVKGKAGRNRNLGFRPIVRGIAMNPVDHPHGGRTNGGRPSVTPWGLPTKSGFYLRPKKAKNF